MSVLALAKGTDDPHRLQNITTQFVSLVQRGANRQSKFFVVKADEEPPPEDPPKDPAAGDEGEEQGAGNEDDKNKGDGDAASAPPADLGAWLDEAGKRADVLLTDAVFDAAMARPSAPASSPPPPVDKAREVGDDRSAPSEVELEKSQREADDLRQQLKEREDQLRKEQLRTKRLKKAAVGGTTALAAAPVGDASPPEEGEVKKRGAWRSGQDLAKQ